MFRNLKTKLNQLNEQKTDVEINNVLQDRNEEHTISNSIQSQTANIKKSGIFGNLLINKTNLKDTSNDLVNKSIYGADNALVENPSPIIKPFGSIVSQLSQHKSQNSSSETNLNSLVSKYIQPKNDMYKRLFEESNDDPEPSSKRHSTDINVPSQKDIVLDNPLNISNLENEIVHNENSIIIEKEKVTSNKSIHTQILNTSKTDLSQNNEIDLPNIVAPKISADINVNNENLTVNSDSDEENRPLVLELLDIPGPAGDIPVLSSEQRKAFLKTGRIDLALRKGSSSGSMYKKNSKGNLNEKKDINKSSQISSAGLSNNNRENGDMIPLSNSTQEEVIFEKFGHANAPKGSLWEYLMENINIPLVKLCKLKYYALAISNVLSINKGKYKTLENIPISKRKSSTNNSVEKNLEDDEDDEIWKQLADSTRTNSRSSDAVSYKDGRNNLRKELDWRFPQEDVINMEFDIENEYFVVGIKDITGSGHILFRNEYDYDSIGEDYVNEHSLNLYERNKDYIQENSECVGVVLYDLSGAEIPCIMETEILRKILILGQNSSSFIENNYTDEFNISDIVDTNKSHNSNAYMNRSTAGIHQILLIIHGSIMVSPAAGHGMIVISKSAIHSAIITCSDHNIVLAGTNQALLVSLL